MLSFVFVLFFLDYEEIKNQRKEKESGETNHIAQNHNVFNSECVNTR